MKSDLISRQAAIDYLVTNMAWYNEDGYEESEDEKLNAITELINGVPPAQSERKTGAWIYPTNVKGFCRCENCHALWDESLYNNKFFVYCPRCSADMGGAR